MKSLLVILKGVKGEDWGTRVKDMVELAMSKFWVGKLVDEWLWYSDFDMLSYFDFLVERNKRWKGVLTESEKVWINLTEELIGDMWDGVIVRREVFEEKRFEQWLKVFNDGCWWDRDEGVFKSKLNPDGMWNKWTFTKGFLKVRGDLKDVYASKWYMIDKKVFYERMMKMDVLVYDVEVERSDREVEEVEEVEEVTRRWSWERGVELSGIWNEVTGKLEIEKRFYEMKVERGKIFYEIEGEDVIVGIDYF